MSTKANLSDIVLGKTNLNHSSSTLTVAASDAGIENDKKNKKVIHEISINAIPKFDFS